jgi:dTMP kinase
LADKTGGVFITFEGGEGAGKSTQIKMAAEAVLRRGRECVVTREPGGTPQAEALRQMLVTGKPGSWSAEAEALLNYAARDSHLRAVIRPALALGTVVISDRFMDSTRAYQGYAGGCDMALIDGLERAIVGSTRPHLTLILDLEAKAGLDRAKRRSGAIEDRFEQKGLAFHQRLQAGFQAIARADPARCRVIDASGSVDEVARDVEAALERVLNGRR